MNVPKVNLLDAGNGTPSAPPPKEKRNSVLAALALAGIFVASFGVGRATMSKDVTTALADIGTLSVFSDMQHLIGSPNRQLRGEAEDRINILLLGQGGEGHDGPFLTDTIMVASIRPSDKRVALLSIPRDLLVPVSAGNWQKINAVNAFGEMREPGHGADATRAVVEGLLGIDVPYYVRIDFGGFTTLVDDVGGVDINVERAFTDYTYPKGEKGAVHTIAFAAGWQHMDGQTALTFTRSRHGTNNEGSDFARAKRQQLVLTALKDRMLSLSLLKNPAAAANTLATLRANIATNMQIGEILRLTDIGKGVDRKAITHRVLDNGPESPLVASVSSAGAFVLLPKNGDWNVIRTMAAAMFTGGQVDTSQDTPPVANVPAKTIDVLGGGNARVEIQNGTDQSGLAREVAGKLKDSGFQVVKIGNADTGGQRKTTVYDLTDGKKIAALSRLRFAINTSGATITTPRLPSNIQADRTVDFLVILGND